MQLMSRYPFNSLIILGLSLSFILFTYACKNALIMESQQKQIIENYIQSYNQFDVDGMLRDVHPDVVFENLSEGEIEMRLEGVEALSKQAHEAKAYFSKRTQTIENWTFEESIVTIQIDYQGILSVDLPNGLKSGDTLSLKGHSVFEFQGDRIIKIQDKV